jgi:plastocyanin
MATLRPRLVLFALFFAAAGIRADQTVTIGPAFAFNPSTVTIAPGETVTWVWAAGGHSTTSDATTGPEVWDSGVRGLGAPFAHTFATAGSFPYYCQVHSVPGGTFMNGVVQVVVPPGSTPTPTPTPTLTAPPTPSPTAQGGGTPPAGPIPTLNEAGLAMFAGALVLASVALIFRKKG